MGRHSASEEENLPGLRDCQPLDEPGSGQLLLARGRHSAPDTAESADPDEIERADTGVVQSAATDGVAAAGAASPVSAQPGAAPSPSPAGPSPAKASPAQASPAQRRQGGTRADLQLMRRNREVLARCIAGLVVPFVLYTVALVVIGATSRYLIWLWVPAIFAGVLMGAFLDSAHKRDRP